MDRREADSESRIRWFLQQTIGKPAGSLACLIPPVYPAYARVLNPAMSPTGRRLRWSQLAGDQLEVDGGTQWSEIVAACVPDPNQVYEPQNGSVDSVVAERLVSRIAKGARPSPECLFLVWEGYGDLNGRVRTSPVIVNGLGRGLHVLRGPLELALESIEDNPAGRLPLNWLPLDGAWCVANDIHALSVFIGGSPSLIGEILGDPELEAYYIRPNQTLVSED
ncbi:MULTISPECIES: hypothetical protein [unclassified Arthrobacter]|jgi:hypothetical protein|uniref:hypothetical protein n=1 Tax=unclassified Arthrobacter TaxID=235627 RepID=UPI00255124D4|nr:hypothetical protein [Arthrobacter sp. efr-133-TYG-120]